MLLIKKCLILVLLTNTIIIKNISISNKIIARQFVIKLYYYFDIENYYKYHGIRGTIMTDIGNLS